MIRPSNGGNGVADGPDKHKHIERFRGWTLTALYFAIALWAIVFCFATYHFWSFLIEQADGSQWQAVSLAVLSAITFLFSARAGHAFLHAMRSRMRLPRVDLLPFLAIAVTILIAGRAFGAG